MRKRIKKKDDESAFVDIPVIYDCPFMSMSEQAQERVLYFNNTSKSQRKTHEKTVTNPIDQSEVEVERVDQITIMDTVSQGQEIVYHFTNTDPPPMQPDGTNDPAHWQTHVVRYFRNNDKDTQCWIDSELIDIAKLIDGNGQEWVYHIKNPDTGEVIDDPNVPYKVTLGFCDPDLPMAPTESPDA